MSLNIPTLPIPCMISLNEFSKNSQTAAIHSDIRARAKIKRLPSFKSFPREISLPIFSTHIQLDTAVPLTKLSHFDVARASEKMQDTEYNFAC